MTSKKALERCSAVIRLPRPSPSTRPWAPRCSTSTKKTTKPSMAILDDWLDIAEQHFSHIPQEKLAVQSVVYDRSDHCSANALAARLRPYTVISTMRERTPFPADLLRQLPNLRLLLATGTQFETFDLAAAAELGVAVVAAPGRGRTDGRKVAGGGGGGPARPRLDIREGGSHPTTQHTWALILALARNVAADDAAVKRGSWQSQLATGLTGTTLGVVGLGRLGVGVARIGRLAWGMRVVCWSKNLTQERANRKAEEMGLPAYGGNPLDPSAPTFQAVGKDELFGTADVVSLHYVLSERSKGLVGERELAQMKPSALLVNTSRGPLVDESALHSTLTRGEIGGAALDVFNVEPLPSTSPWRSTVWGKEGTSKLIITPHMGYVEEGLMHTWYEKTAEHLERWLDGKELLHRLT